MKTRLRQNAEGEILRQWLDTIPRGQYNNVKDRLVSECLIQKHTLNNWIYGICRIPDAGKRDINRVTLEISGIEIFTIAKSEAKGEGESVIASGEAI